VTELDAPRILLLSCPLEHERRTFTSSLEALRQQPHPTQPNPTTNP